MRLGTASMLTEPDGPFIDVSKLNIPKYASKPDLAKVREGWMDGWRVVTDWYHQTSSHVCLILSSFNCTKTFMI